MISRSFLRPAALGLLTLLAGCNKSGNPAPAAREYTVQYQVSATGSSTASVIAYSDAMGNLTQLSNVTLPATYTFKRTMRSGDGLSIVVSVAAPSTATTLTANILLDGKVVQTQSGTSPGGGTTGASATANIAYVIP